MILNHKEAIAYLVRHVETLEPNESTIRTIHYLLADSLVSPGTAGQIRNESVRASGRTYAPIEGRERLTRLLNALLAKARANLRAREGPHTSNRSERRYWYPHWYPGWNLPEAC